VTRIATSRPQRIAPLSTLFAVLVLYGVANSAAAPESHAKIDLIADLHLLQPSSKLWAGVLFRLDPGWHIYWQNAGDSGEPPKIHWTLPAGFTAGAIAWPTPTRLGSGSIMDYGYENQVLLMVPIEAPSPEGSGKSNPVELAADVNYLVCREVCIPGKAHASLALPPNNASSSQAAEWQTLFRQTRAQLPRPAPIGWKIAARSRGERLVLSVDAGIPVEKATFFPLEPNVVENSAPQDFAPARKGFQLTLKKSEQLTTQISKLTGVLVLNGGRAYEIAVPVLLQ
jgi:DsbC/DsbD-like thiol-disulfide interchange protein